MKKQTAVHPDDLEVRDALAIAAMVGILAGRGGDETNEEAVAMLAYDQADAMLAQRMRKADPPFPPNTLSP